MKNLSKLKVELEQNQKRVSQIREQILALELKKRLPALKKKYEGKFWKYRKSTGVNSISWVYSYCREVVDECTGNFDQFQMTDQHNGFKINEQEYFTICETAISKVEYLKALKQFQSKATELANCD